MLNFEVLLSLLGPHARRSVERSSTRGLTSPCQLRRIPVPRHPGAGIPIPGHRDFDEVNLRLYVRRRGEDGEWRRAVVFVRGRPRPAIATVARWFYNQPDTVVPMRHELEMEGAADGESWRAAYAWRLAGRWHHLELRPAGGPHSRPGLLGASSRALLGLHPQRDGRCKEYRVTHPPMAGPGMRSELSSTAT